MKQKIVCIVGPTASGKTSLGIAIAKAFNGEVISVDSRQVFREMNIGTAKPEGKWTEREIEKGGGIDQLFGARKMLLVEDVVHWGIDLVNPDEEYSVAQFKEYAEKKIADIAARGKVPILVGGTGLWFRAIIDNLDLASTPSDATLRAELEARALGDLFHEYKQLDPEGAQMIDRKNKRRVVRALEVTKLTGTPFSQLRTTSESNYDALQIGLKIERDVLYERINLRVDEMVVKGLVDEVRKLKETYGCTIDAMTGIGYRQICAFLSGDESLESAIEETKKASRHYAKRQLTWFHRDDRIDWISDPSHALTLVETFLK